MHNAGESVGLMNFRITITKTLNKSINIFKLLLLFILISSDVEAESILSDENELLRVNFFQKDNPTMTRDGNITKGRNNIYYATLPFSITNDEVNVEFITSVNSTVSINGKKATVIEADPDCSDVSVSTATVSIEESLSVRVVSESGASQTYDLIVKKGIWEVDSLVYAFMEKYNIPGVSLALINLSNASSVYQSGFGYAVKESKTKVRQNHLFRLASMSKQHTAICILKLVEEGKLDIDGFVFGPSGILKDDFPNAPVKAQRITIRHLLEHTSGYSRRPDFLFDRAYTGWSMERRIKSMLNSRHPNEPGEVFAYYNMGYGILGYIVEVVTGKSFEEYLTELYEPLGIDDIHVGQPQSQRRWNEVAYYSQTGASSEGVDMDIRAAAGGLIASTDQLIKLIRGLDGNPLTPDLISCEIRDLMFTPSDVGESRYSLGWRTNHRLFPYSFYHGGTLAGVATLWVYSHNYVVILLCNSRSPLRSFDEDLYKTARDITWVAEELDF